MKIWQYVYGLMVLMMSNMAMAADTTKGLPLKATYDALNDLSSGYGKQLIMVIAFTGALITLSTLKGMAAVVSFVGVAVFASVGLAVGLGIAGALI